MLKCQLWLARRGPQALLTGLIISLLMSSCGTVRETLTARSAMEQLLLSTAADRACDAFPAETFRDKRVFLDLANLECTDKGYVTQCLRNALLDGGAMLAKAPADAEVTIEVASGSLALNKREMLLGLPALPVPIPYAGESLKFPEVPIWKLITYRGRAKLLLCAVDPVSGAKVADVPLCRGSTRDSYWWALILGPVRHSDMPEDTR